MILLSLSLIGSLISANENSAKRVDHLKSGFSIAESQQLYTQRIRSRVGSRAANVTDSFLAVHANNDVNGSFMSLKSAQILQKYKAGIHGPIGPTLGPMLVQSGPGIPERQANLYT